MTKAQFKRRISHEPNAIQELNAFEFRAIRIFDRTSTVVLYVEIHMCRIEFFNYFTYDSTF